MADVVNRVEAVIAYIRELVFDRFGSPTFFLAAKAQNNFSYPVTTDLTLSIDTTRLLVKKSDSVALVSISFSDYPTLGQVLDKLSAQPELTVIFSGSFIGTEPSNTLRQMPDTKLCQFIPVTRTVTFSDSYIKKIWEKYVSQYYCQCTCNANTDWELEFSVPGFNCSREEHLALWTAYQLVGQRRLYDAAAQALMQTGTGTALEVASGTPFVDSSSFGVKSGGTSTTVNVGDVFTLSEEPNAMWGVQNDGAIPQDMLAPWQKGSDNVLMDYYSFWYRLQLWIRDKFETAFPTDNSLRKDTVILGKDKLINTKNWWAYFDNYPWTFSPYLRGMPSFNPTAGRIV